VLFHGRPARVESVLTGKLNGPHYRLTDLESGKAIEDGSPISFGITTVNAN
jgi:hypothetical protein